MKLMVNCLKWSFSSSKRAWNDGVDLYAVLFVLAIAILERRLMMAALTLNTLAFFLTRSSTCCFSSASLPKMRVKKDSCWFFSQTYSLSRALMAMSSSSNMVISFSNASTQIFLQFSHTSRKTSVMMSKSELSRRVCQWQKDLWLLMQFSLSCMPFSSRGMRSLELLQSQKSLSRQTKLACCVKCRFSLVLHSSHIFRLAQFSKVQTNEISCLWRPHTIYYAIEYNYIKHQHISPIIPNYQMHRLHLAKGQEYTGYVGYIGRMGKQLMQSMIIQRMIMIKIAIIVLSLLLAAPAQDAVLTPTEPFRLELRETATYHQAFLLEVDPAHYNPEWNVLYGHQWAVGHSVVELQLEIVHKQFPERQGHRFGKCRLEHPSNRWCRVDLQGFHIPSHLIKVKLDCVSDCHANVTVGFAHHEWKGDQLPIVKSSPLEQIQQGSQQQSPQDNRAGLKMLGFMVLTLVLVLLAIQLGEKVAFKFDEKVERDRMQSLRTKSTPMRHSKSD